MAIILENVQLTSIGFNNINYFIINYRLIFYKFGKTHLEIR